MLLIVIMMIVILVVAGSVLACVAFPRHKDSLPAPARVLGEMMARASDAVPTLDADDDTGPGRRARLFD